MKMISEKRQLLIQKAVSDWLSCPSDDPLMDIHSFLIRYSHSVPELVYLCSVLAAHCKYNDFI